MKFGFSGDQKAKIAYASNNGVSAVIHLEKKIPFEQVKSVALRFGFKVEHHFKNKHQLDVSSDDVIVASIHDENLVVLSNKVTTRHKKEAVDFVNALLEN